MAGEELLHGGLFEVPLFANEPVQRTQKRIHIAQRPRDGALFEKGGVWNMDPPQYSLIQRSHRCADGILKQPRLDFVTLKLTCQIRWEAEALWTNANSIRTEEPSFFIFGYESRSFHRSFSSENDIATAKDILWQSPNHVLVHPRGVFSHFESAYPDLTH